MSEGPKKAGVLGSPIAHSRSPQLHLAAYRALGLHDWTYERIECGAAELPVVVGGFGPEWVGVSVTMPGKFVELAEALARRVSPTPVRLADERLTTVSAQRSLRQAGVRASEQRAVIDQAAAVAILQSWLDERLAAMAGTQEGSDA